MKLTLADFDQVSRDRETIRAATPGLDFHDVESHFTWSIFGLARYYFQHGNPEEKRFAKKIIAELRDSLQGYANRKGITL